MSAEAATIIASILGGAIGGIAAIAAYMHGYLNTERTERRKQMIDLVQELIASRYVLDGSYSASDIDVRDFNRAMARIPYAFSHSQPVIAAYDRLLTDKTTDNVLSLLEKAMEAAGLKEYAVARSHLSRVMTLPTGSRLRKD